MGCGGVAGGQRPEHYRSLNLSATCTFFIYKEGETYTHMNAPWWVSLLWHVNTSLLHRTVLFFFYIYVNK